MCVDTGQEGTEKGGTRRTLVIFRCLTREFFFGAIWRGPGLGPRAAGLQLHLIVSLLLLIIVKLQTIGIGIGERMLEWEKKSHENAVKNIPLRRARVTGWLALLDESLSHCIFLLFFRVEEDV